MKSNSYGDKITRLDEPGECPNDSIEWIDASWTLPEDQEIVFCFSENGSVGFAYWDEGKNEFIPMAFGFDANLEEEIIVSFYTRSIPINFKNH